MSYILDGKTLWMYLIFPVRKAVLSCRKEEMSSVLYG